MTYYCDGRLDYRRIMSNSGDTPASQSQLILANRSDASPQICFYFHMNPDRPLCSILEKKLALHDFVDAANCCEESLLLRRACEFFRQLNCLNFVFYLYSFPFRSVPVSLQSARLIATYLRPCQTHHPPSVIHICSFFSVSDPL